ncbi:phage associated protein [Neisseria gonorrhoeae]|nr:phage associated protein [Neisseria gonorrhoeae]CNR00264.1 phage associated protein [Neisseria gonorrhoeae]SBN15055.1 phage associated protein [Neisseria gonorrhoeae]SBN16073.1 phage associated protein [Neisseria gonorrhoeae]
MPCGSRSANRRSVSCKTLQHSSSNPKMPVQVRRILTRDTAQITVGRQAEIQLETPPCRFRTLRVESLRIRDTESLRQSPINQIPMMYGIDFRLVPVPRHIPRQAIPPGKQPAVTVRRRRKRQLPVALHRINRQPRLRPVAPTRGANIRRLRRNQLQAHRLAVGHKTDTVDFIRITRRKPPAA